MGDLQVGTGHIFALAGAAISCSLSGYVSPNLQTLNATHEPDAKVIKGQGGQVTGLIFPDDDIINLTFDVIPEGTSRANAKLSAGLPAKGAAFGITGLPILVAGAFVDALNTNAGNTQPWFYEGGGEWVGPIEGQWTMRLPLKRYRNITVATAVT